MQHVRRGFSLSLDRSEEFPKLFGRYIFLDCLATGGMAEIFRAVTRDEVGRVVVIKRVHSQYRNNQEFMNMFRDEVRITSLLNHPNIIHVNNYSTQGDFIELEYVRGRTIRQIFQKMREIGQTVPQDLAIYFIQEACKGLFYAHNLKDERTGDNLGIIHRDISPQNIMVSFEGEVKVFDFGIAKAQSKLEETRAGVVKGKFAYMSPEQADPNIDLDHRTDVYSLGIVLWELLTGKKLFAAKEEIQILDLIRQSNIQSPNMFNPKLGQKVCEVVMKGLQKDRNIRFADMERFRHALSEVPKRDFISQDISLIARNWMKQMFLQEFNEEKESLQRLYKTVEAFLASKPKEEVWETIANRGSTDPIRGLTGPARDFNQPGRGISQAAPLNTSTSSVSDTHPIEKRSRKKLVMFVAIFLASIGVGAVFSQYGENVKDWLSGKKPALSFGEITLDGLPNTGLTILINGKSVGDSFPITIREPMGKTLEVVVSHAGYESWREVLEVRESQLQRRFQLVPIALSTAVPAQQNDEQEPRSSVATLKIKSNVPLNEIIVDGVPSKDPSHAVKVPKGRTFLLEVGASGYRRRSGRVSIPDETGEITVRLVKYDYGILEVISTPADSKVTIRSRSDTSYVRTLRMPIRGERLPVGEYDLVFENELLGLKSRESVRITLNKITKLNVTLKP